MEEKNQLLLQLHEQFSQNQNDNNNRFNSTFIALLALFAIYGFVYSISIGIVEFNGYKIFIEATVFLAIVADIVINYLIKHQLAISYTHRRDQKINDTIRKNLVGNNYSDYFSFYSGRNKNSIEYIIEPNKINIQLLLVIKILILASVISLFFICCKYYFEQPINWLLIVLNIVFLFFAFYSAFRIFKIFKFYSKKYSRVYDLIDNEKINCLQFYCQIFQFNSNNQFENSVVESINDENPQDTDNSSTKTIKKIITEEVNLKIAKTKIKFKKQ
jgi:hypothetical protein